MVECNDTREISISINDPYIGSITYAGPCDLGSELLNYAKRTVSPSETVKDEPAVNTIKGDLSFAESVTVGNIWSPKQGDPVEIRVSDAERYNGRTGEIVRHNGPWFFVYLYETEEEIRVNYNELKSLESEC